MSTEMAVKFAVLIYKTCMLFRLMDLFLARFISKQHAKSQRSYKNDLPKEMSV